MTFWRKQEEPPVLKEQGVLPSVEELKGWNETARRQAIQELEAEFASLPDFETFVRCPKCGSGKLSRRFARGPGRVYLHRRIGLLMGLAGSGVELDYVPIKGYGRLIVECRECDYGLGCERSADGESGLEE